jgi:peroxiredoxin
MNYTPWHIFQNNRHFFCRSIYLSILIVSCVVNSLEAQEQFTIRGIVTGFEDSVRIIFNKTLPLGEADLKTEKTIFPIGGAFVFTDSIDAPTKYAVRIRPKSITNENFTDYENLFMYAENKSMNLIAQKGEFEFAHITGSDIQTAYEAFVNLNKAIKIRNKQIVDAVKMNLTTLDAKTMGEMRGVFRKNDEKIRNTNLDYLLSHPEHYFSTTELALMTIFNPEIVSKDRVATFYEKIPANYQYSQSGKLLFQYIHANTNYTKLKAGSKAFDFTLKDSSEQEISLHSLKGKYVLLDFWFVACAPCRAAHPDYLSVYQEYHQKGFDILSVSIDKNRDQWLAAIDKDNMIWKSVLDDQGKIANDLYHINSFPSNYLINPQGIVIGQNLSGKDLMIKLKDLCK